MAAPMETGWLRLRAGDDLAGCAEQREPARSDSTVHASAILVAGASSGRYGRLVMDATKEQAVKHHEAAATALENASKAHREAVKHASSGNFEKAQRYNSSASELADAALRHTTEAGLVYAGIEERKAAADQERSDELAAAAAKHAAKKTDA